MEFSTGYCGRKQIFTDEKAITRENVLSVIEDAMQTHLLNSAQIKYLSDYRDGKQDICFREIKRDGDTIRNTVVNHADEIVTFKNGYLLGSPIQYISRSTVGSGVAETESPDISSGINALNNFMVSENKHLKDQQLINWMHTCGIGYRMVLPDAYRGLFDDSPFRIYTLNPATTFVVYSSSIGNDPMIGVTYVVKKDGTTEYTAYTKNAVFTISGGNGGYRIESEKPHFLNDIPIIEYPANFSRMGAFENVIPLLNAINLTTSNRVEGVEKFVDALMVFVGMDVNAEDIENLKKDRGIAIPKDTDIKYLVQELNQSQTQTLIDDMYENVLIICGMPNRNFGGSTSDTGTATIYRNGWEDATSRAKNTESIFKGSERNFLKIVLNILRVYQKIDLNLADIDINFTAKNYENVQSKVQVLTTMLACDMVHPLYAFVCSNLFTDPEMAYAISEQYYNAKQEKQKKELMELSGENEYETQEQMTADDGGNDEEAEQ